MSAGPPKEAKAPTTPPPRTCLPAPPQPTDINRPPNAIPIVLVIWAIETTLACAFLAAASRRLANALSMATRATRPIRASKSQRIRIGTVRPDGIRLRYSCIRERPSIFGMRNGLRLPVRNSRSHLPNSVAGFRLQFPNTHFRNRIPKRGVAKGSSARICERSLGIELPYSVFWKGNRPSAPAFGIRNGLRFPKINSRSHLPKAGAGFSQLFPYTQHRNRLPKRA